MTSRTSSMPGAWLNAATQCSTSVRPPTVSSCLGIEAPNRLPTPPPSTTAAIHVTATSGTLLAALWRGYPRQSRTAQYAERWRTGYSGRMGMAAQELAANQRAAGPGSDPVARDVARWATALRLTPVAMSAISVSFAAIAAVWLTSITVRAGATAFAALAAAFVTGRAARLMGGRPATAATEWGQAACAFLTEVVVYAGIVGGATANAAASAGTGLTGPVGVRLRDTSVAGLGEPGIIGVWRLAVAAVIALALLQMADMCLAATPGEAIRARRFGVLVGAPGDWRLLFIGGAVLLAGARGTFLLLLVLAVLALGAMLIGRPGSLERPRWLAGYRGDGPLAVWIGQFVDGRLPPLAPLLVGLLVTGMLAALGLQNLPGILVLTPVEAMLLAALASWHPHAGPGDWLAPPLLEAGECLFLAALGFAGRVSPPATFALLAAVALHRLDLAYRARNDLVPSPVGPLIRQEGRLPYSDRSGFGWDGRMIIAGIAAWAG